MQVTMACLKRTTWFDPFASATTFSQNSWPRDRVLGEWSRTKLSVSFRRNGSLPPAAFRAN